MGNLNIKKYEAVVKHFKTRSSLFCQRVCNCLRHSRGKMYNRRYLHRSLHGSRNEQGLIEKIRQIDKLLQLWK